MVLSTYKLFVFVVAFAGLEQVHAACEPEISFPVPKYGSNTLHDAFATIDSSLEKAIGAGEFDRTSFSLEISSSKKTLHTKYHFDKSLGGSPINGSSVYRVASNTKVFTALGIIRLEAAGKLSLDDKVTDYIPVLSNGNSKISWGEITIRSLLSHSSGLQDNCESINLDS
jgi:CubicO group peptidase (beta-lactamase class C family)